MRNSRFTKSVTPISRPLDLKSEIRRRAYSLYEQRGKVDGFALEDWLRAQAEWLEEYLQKQAEPSGGR